MNERFEAAAVAIFIAMIMDGLDGRVARMTNTQSAFGAEYDSMADMVSFGIAPALVAYNWGLVDLGKIGWLSAFIFVAGAALRLARFNTQVGIADKRFFQGLASPAAAAIIAGMVWVGDNYEINGSDVSFIVAIITVAAGLLMVSNFRYHSFKDVDWKGKVSFVAILVVVLIFVVVATNPALVLFAIFLLYAISGPVVTLRSVRELKMEHVVGDGNDADFESSDQSDEKEKEVKANPSSTVEETAENDEEKK
ncbi:CDP-diacylglycerol--serine O-phosphatidyltransferase [Corallincola platygyrae]